MLYGYMRKRANGPDLESQKKALESMGIDVSDTEQVRTDAPNPGTHAVTKRHLKQRSDVLATLTQGDVLIAPDYATLFLSPTDAMEVVADVAKAQAILVIAEDGARYEWKPSDSAIAAEIAILASKTQKALTREIAAKAREAREKAGNMGGRRPQVNRKKLEAARRDWEDPIGPSSAEIAEKHGIPRTTLIRHLGSISEARDKQKKARQ